MSTRFVLIRCSLLPNGDEDISSIEMSCKDLAALLKANAALSTSEREQAIMRLDGGIPHLTHDCSSKNEVRTGDDHDA